MPLNRKQEIRFSLFDARSGKPNETELDTFERIAQAEGAPVSRWIDMHEAGTATVGDVLDLRAEVRALKTRLQTRGRELAANVNHPDARQQAEDMQVAARAAGRIVEASTALIERAEGDQSTGLATRGARPAGTDASALATRTAVRTGAEWRSLYGHLDDEAQLRAHEEGEFGIDDFVRAVAGMRTSEVAKRALSVGTNSAGGFTVPTVLMPGILDALAPASSLLTAGAGIVRMDGEADGAKNYSWAALQTLPTAAWRNENGNVAESDPVFRNISATPRSLAFHFKVSRELLADGQGLRDALNIAIGQAFAKELDRAGLRGTGTAPEPRGILNTVGIQAVGNGAAGASLATVRWGNLMSGVSAILNADGPMPTAAIMAPRTLVGFGNLADTTNQPLQRPQMLAGLQFLSTSAIPIDLTVGGSTDCSELYLGNFGAVRFVMREQPSIQLLVERYADVGQIGFLCHVRADVIVTYPSTLAVVTGIRP